MPHRFSLRTLCRVNLPRPDSRIPAVVLTLCFTTGVAAAARMPDSPPSETTAPSRSQHTSGAAFAARPRREREIQAVKFNLDEHLLVDGSHDRDYAGGGDIVLSGAIASHDGLDSALGGIDRMVLGRTRMTAPRHALSLGLVIFTPADLTWSSVQPGDRPYASLFFLSTGRRYVEQNRPVAFESSLTFGMLGLAAAGSFQSALHHMTGSLQPHGWRHQISAGGEPTLRYDVAREALLASRYGQARPDYALKWATAASIGTVTEGSVALSLRWGRIASPWWGFTPEQDMYVEEVHPAPPPPPRGVGRELFALLGARLKVRLYNAFLQGQFRHSDLRYSLSRLNPVLAEAWAGMEYRNTSGLSIRYLVRWQSAELRYGIGSRSLLWGNVEITEWLGH